MNKSAKEAVEKLIADGYEIAHSQESYGEHIFGMMIFVKMSNRKLCNEDHFYAEARAIQDKLEANSSKLDLELSIRRGKYKQQIIDIYKNAGVETIYIEELPNGYTKDPYTPWFRITTKIGHVVIGWRRFVMHIDWKDTVIKITGDGLSNDNVTKSDTFIHAHGVAKATEYIKRLHDEDIIKAGNG